MQRCLLACLTYAVLASTAGHVLLSQTPKREPSQKRESDATGARDLKYETPGTRTAVPAQTVVPRGYAVVIGIAKYPSLSAANQLRFAESDAEAIYRVLISAEGGAVPPENVRKLIGADATLANVRQALELWLPSVASPADRVIVYFAGHGFIQGGRGYLAPVDVDLNRLDATSYPMSRLGSTLATKVKARWKMLLTDACHSGKLTAATTEDQLVQSMGAEQSFLTFTASRGSEQSFEDPQLGNGYGVFSYFLEKGWYGAADRNGDPIITADELIDYVRTQVKDYTRNRGASQTPQESPDFDPGMILGYNSHRSGEKLQQPYGELVVETTMDGVDVEIDDKPAGSAQRDRPLVLSGIAAGLHTVRGSKSGYDPATVQVQVIPGMRQSVTLRIQFLRKRNRASDEMFRRARKLYDSQKNQRELQQAEQLFGGALAADPKDPESALYLCYTRQLLGNSSEAVEACKQATELAPSDGEARSQYGIVLLETGDSAGAVRQFAEAARINPRMSVAFSHLAQAYRFTGAFPESIRAATDALRLDPGNAQAYLWRGDSLRLMGRFDEAREDYRAYLERNNMNSTLGEQLRFYLVGFGSSKKRPDQRMVYANQQYVALSGICECEQRLGNLLRAKSYCERARDLDTQDVYVNFFLGKIHSLLFNRTHQRDELLTARPYFEKVVALNPDSDEGHQSRDYVRQIDAALSKLR